MANYKIDTPHAAVIIWNYNDRLGSDEPTNAATINSIDQVVVSTLSCLSIETNKAKSNPVGTFQLTLAPFKNWVSTITPGSWCVLLMSQNPITEQDIITADPNKVKMIGKIETVRVSTAQSEDGKRQTQYFVNGVDWGHIFANIVYVDNNIASPNEKLLLGNGVAVALQNILFGKDGVPQRFQVRDLLHSILQIFGKPLDGFTGQAKDANRLANAVYTFLMPQKMVEYFKFVGPNNKQSNSQQINKLITLYCGVLDRYDHYNNNSEAFGFIDPFSLQGARTFWQLLIENSNPALNEMFSEMRWEDGKPRFALYNRIKPFSFKGFNSGAGISNNLRSYFQFVKTHDIDPVTVMAVNAGTNWRDKYNFVEIKPMMQDYEIFAYWYKSKTQQFDATAFQREGFRPLIVETKQYPGSVGSKELVAAVEFEALESWTSLLKEWYFDTHRMLNGTLTMVGGNNYIAVGDNIKFDAGLMNPTANLSASTIKRGENQSIMAHVESVSHRFTNNNGARSFVTTIQFVRGIIVDSNSNPVGRGTLDAFDSSIDQDQERNSKNVISSSDVLDPDFQKPRGT